MAVRVIVTRKNVPNTVKVNPWKLHTALLKGQRPESKTASVKGKPNTAIKTSDKAKHAMKMFDVLRRRGCLNIVQQTNKFPPIADKRLINVTVLIQARLKGHFCLPVSSPNLPFLVHPFTPWIAFNTQWFNGSAIQFILTAIAPAATHPG